MAAKKAKKTKKATTSTGKTPKRKAARGPVPRTKTAKTRQSKAQAANAANVARSNAKMKELIAKTMRPSKVIPGAMVRRRGGAQDEAALERIRGGGRVKDRWLTEPMTGSASTKRDHARFRFTPQDRATMAVGARVGKRGH